MSLMKYMAVFMYLGNFFFSEDSLSSVKHIVI